MDEGDGHAIVGGLVAKRIDEDGVCEDPRHFGEAAMGPGGRQKKEKGVEPGHGETGQPVLWPVGVVESRGSVLRKARA